MTTNIDTFYNSIINETDKYYVFVSSPNVKYTAPNIQSDTLLVKRVVASDVMYGLNRYDWTYGDTFDQYTDVDVANNTLKFKKFYTVVNFSGKYKVFKCINNNKASPSTISPATITRFGIVTLADGYSWIFMYDIPNNVFKKFSSDKYIPFIPNASTTSNAINGIVASIQITNGGFGYTYCTAVITGDGLEATAQVILTNSIVTKVIVNNVGSVSGIGGIPYTNATISFIGDGAGASANVALSPSGGHGFNQKTELYCNTLILSSIISSKADQKILPHGVSYSSYGLLKNITYGNNVGDSTIDYIDVVDGGTNFINQEYPVCTITGGFDAAQVTAGTNVNAVGVVSVSKPKVVRVVLQKSGINYRTTPTVSITSAFGSGVVTNTVMKSVALRAFTKLNVNTIEGVFKKDEIIKQGNTTAQILFVDYANNYFGLYNIVGTFVGNSTIEGQSSGAFAKTNSSNFLNTPDAVFDSTNLVHSYTNNIVSRQEDQPEKINISLLF